MGISKETIQKVQDSIEILDIIGDFVQLKKKGKGWWACCPFHHEKSPSFAISPEKGIYKCFGCGKAGDGLKFVMEHEKLSYPDAIRYLANKYKIEIVEVKSTLGEDVKQTSQNESLYIVLNQAKDYFVNTLQSEEGLAVGLSYFKERGLSEEIIKKFELGYSLDSWDGFVQHAKKNLISEEYIEKAGLVILKDTKIYDRFRGRVIFPIHNLIGKVVAFGARILTNDKTQPKYINSPETDLYHKGQLLYGIFQAKQAIRQIDCCYLTEGYTDVLSLQQAGIQNVVASLGTSLTEEQAKLMHRFTNHAIVLYDGDSAGIKASIRGIDILLAEGLDVKVVAFPDGEDPDSYVRKLGSVEFKKFLIANCIDFLIFKTTFLLKETEGDPFKKAEVIKEVATSIGKIPDSIRRGVYFKETAILLNISEEILLTEYNKGVLLKRKNDIQEVELVPEYSEYQLIETPVKSNSLSLQEKELIRLLFHYGNLSIDDQDSLIDVVLEEISEIKFQSEVCQLIKNTFEELLEIGVIPGIDFWKKHETTSIRDLYVELVANDFYEPSKNWGKFQIIVPAKDANLPQAIYGLLLRLKKRNTEKIIKDLQNEMNKSTSEVEKNELLKKIMAYMTTKNELAKLLGTVIN